MQRGKSADGTEKKKARYVCLADAAVYSVTKKRWSYDIGISM